MIYMSLGYHSKILCRLCLSVSVRHRAFSNYINIDEFVNVIEDNGFLKKDFLIL